MATYIMMVIEVQNCLGQMKLLFESLAYCMRYSLGTPGEVAIFKNDSHDLKEYTMKLFIDWLITSHGLTPKTYQNLITSYKKINDLIHLQQKQLRRS